MDANRIKEIIDKSGYSHMQLAKATGLSRQTIDLLVTCNDCKVSTLEKVASVLGVDIAYILGKGEIVTEKQCGKNIFLRKGDSNGQFNEPPCSITDQIETMKKTIAAQEKTISTQQMLIDLLTKK